MDVKIAICDDEQQQVFYLKSLVLKWAHENAKEISITTFYNAEAFWFAWSEEKSFDILLLDIQMDGQNGIELARDLRNQDENISIIFITGLPEYIGDGYEVSALHYLIKPVQENKLFETLNKACNKINKEPKSILVSIGDESVRILQNNIIFVEAFAHTILIQTTNEGYEVKKSIGDIEKELDSDAFVRCHRSYIVGLKYIKRISKTDFSLDNGKTIPLSRRVYNNANKAFINYFKGDN